MLVVHTFYILLQLHHFGKWHSHRFDSVNWHIRFHNHTLDKHQIICRFHWSLFLSLLHDCVTYRFIFHVYVTSENLKRPLHITGRRFIVLHRVNGKIITVSSGDRLHIQFKFHFGLVTIIGQSFGMLSRTKNGGAAQLNSFDFFLRSPSVE